MFQFLQIITEFDEYLLVLAIFLGFLGGLFDNSFGMGYGLLSPIFVFIGFDILVVVPTLLLSQAITGFSGTIFHSLNKNVNFGSKETRESRIYYLPDLFLLLYIGLMMIIIGIIVLFKINFGGSWNKLYAISVIAGFNKAISGGGYGPLVTSGQLMAGGEVRNSVGVTQFSESTISILAFLLYFVFNDFAQIMLTFQLAIIMVFSGMFSAPIGAMIARKLDESVARKVVAWLSISIGIITLLRILLL